MNGNAAERGMSIADIKIRVFEDVPRVLDAEIAARLGLAQPLNIRAVIQQNREELERYGSIHVVRENSGAKGGRPATVNYLNEEQALLIAVLSRGPRAAEVREILIRTFVAWRRGREVGPASPSTLDDHAAAVIGGVVKVVVRKQLEPVMEQLGVLHASAELLLESAAKLVDVVGRERGEAIAAVPNGDAAPLAGMLTAHEVINGVLDVPKAKRFGGLAGQVSARIARYCARKGFRVGVVDTRPGEKLAFPREAVFAWAEGGGRVDIWKIINRHAEKVVGQHTLGLASSR